VQAAARAHLKTGLTIACHTGERQAALGVLATVEEEGVHPSALIVVHADGIAEEEARFRLADAGAWVEYDGAGGRPVAEHVALVQRMFVTGRSDRLLLSHDAGWYSAGEPGGAREKIRPYTFIAEKLLPALEPAGLGEEAVKKLLITNPRQAFAIRVRKR
jgi:phosphotriesterase-related protein